ncbi:MAG TPA: EcsC family protein [Acidimicrobiales bacterium]|nr:EcsC family protein [Acidimicrobiales bacterium]
MKDRAPARFGLDNLGSVLLEAVDRAAVTRWDGARRRAAAAPGATTEERARAVTRTFARELAVAGAATGGAAAVPGVGTATAMAATAADLGWFTLRIADLILTVAALHGHDRASVEERRAWILSVLAFGEGSAAGFARMAGEMGHDLGRKAVSRIPASALRAINRKLGRSLLARFGTRRGSVTLGRMLPFGIGAAVGGSANYMSVQAIGRHAESFFGSLPYGLPPAATSGSGGEEPRAGR